MISAQERATRHAARRAGPRVVAYPGAIGPGGSADPCGEGTGSLRERASPGAGPPVGRKPVTARALGHRTAPAGREGNR